MHLFIIPNTKLYWEHANAEREQRESAQVHKFKSSGETPTYLIFAAFRFYLAKN
jgi:hypothetical protein